MVGTSRWSLHGNDGGGFATDASAWTLPSYGPDAFESVGGASDCGGGNLAPGYALADLDGDEALDLVITDHCSDTSVGASRWLRHTNDGDGFGAATDFGLPDYGPAFPSLTGAGDCGGGMLRPSYALLDLDGDGHTDLVVTDVCAEAAVGSSHWRVHRGACP